MINPAQKEITFAEAQARSKEHVEQASRFNANLQDFIKHKGWYVLGYRSLELYMADRLPDLDAIPQLRTQVPPLSVVPTTEKEEPKKPLPVEVQPPQIPEKQEPLPEEDRLLVPDTKPAFCPPKTEYVLPLLVPRNVVKQHKKPSLKPILRPFSDWHGYMMTQGDLYRAMTERKLYGEPTHKTKFHIPGVAIIRVDDTSVKGREEFKVDIMATLFNWGINGEAFIEGAATGDTLVHLKALQAKGLLKAEGKEAVAEDVLALFRFLKFSYSGLVKHRKGATFVSPEVYEARRKILYKDQEGFEEGTVEVQDTKTVSMGFCDNCGGRLSQEEIDGGDDLCDECWGEPEKRKCSDCTAELGRKGWGVPDNKDENSEVERAFCEECYTKREVNNDWSK